MPEGDRHAALLEDEWYLPSPLVSKGDRCAALLEAEWHWDETSLLEAPRHPKVLAFGDSVLTYFI